jgi:hypothetical protein
LAARLLLEAGIDSRRRRSAHEEYVTQFEEWKRTWSPAELAAAVAGGYDKPLPFEYPPPRSWNGEDDEFYDAADRAVDNRIPIVDFESVGENDLQRYCDHFGIALAWATKGKRDGSLPDLMQMGWRALAILKAMRPQLAQGMKLRIPRKAELQLRAALSEQDPLETGRFFRLVLAWIRKCSSLSQLGQRFYSLIQILRHDLVDGITCEEIGAFKNSTRQAANKPGQEFSDTFSGIKNLPMRKMKTRIKCQQSQIAKRSR